MFNRHRIFAALGAALAVVGHNVPGPIGWVCMAVGEAVLVLVDKDQVIKGAAADGASEPTP